MHVRPVCGIVSRFTANGSVRKAIRTVTGRNARGEVVEVQREVEEAIIDDHLPAIADLFAKWLRQGAAHRWMHEMNSPARVERPQAETPVRQFNLGSRWLYTEDSRLGATNYAAGAFLALDAIAACKHPARKPAANSALPSGSRSGTRPAAISNGSTQTSGTGYRLSVRATCSFCR